MTEGVALNQPCTTTAECTDTVPNSRCSGTAASKTCQCDFGYEENGGNCKGSCLLLYLPFIKADYTDTAVEYRHHYLIKLILTILCICIN